MNEAQPLKVVQLRLFMRSAIELKALCRRAAKECLLVIFQWNGRPEALHVLREKGADACTGAIWAHQLQARTFPLPASARR